MGKKQATPGKAGTDAPAAPPRAGGVRHLAALMPRLTRPALGKRGLAEGGIVADWPAIVGPELAAMSLPERLAFPQGARGQGARGQEARGQEARGQGGRGDGARRDGTLHVRVAGALALELQHLEPVVIERINSYFGYRAVARIRIRQAPIPLRHARRSVTAPLDPEAVREVDAAVADVADPALRAALAGFGRALRGRKA